MSFNRNDNEIVILDAAAAAGAGTARDVSEYRHVSVYIASASNADLTVKCQGSLDDTAPTWTSAASVTNPWDYVLMYDYEDATALDGDTGLVLTGTDDCRQFLINVEGLKWLNFRVTARAAGNVTVKMRCFNNQ